MRASAADCSFAPIETGRSAGRSMDVGGMTIADLRFSPGQKLPSHAHELATITVTMDGNFETLIEGRAYQNPLHAVLCKPQGSMHGNAFGRTAVRVVMLSIDGDGDEFRPCARSLRDVVHAIDPRAGARRVRAHAAGAARGGAAGVVGRADRGARRRAGVFGSEPPDANLPHHHRVHAGVVSQALSSVVTAQIHREAAKNAKSLFVFA